MNIQALSLKAFPSSLEWSLESFASIIDEIWYWAGDRSTDINWYTKRGILAGIYSSTGTIFQKNTSLTPSQAKKKCSPLRLEDSCV